MFLPYSPLVWVSRLKTTQILCQNNGFWWFLILSLYTEQLLVKLDALNNKPKMDQGSLHDT